MESEWRRSVAAKTEVMRGPRGLPIVNVPTWSSCRHRIEVDVRVDLICSGFNSEPVAFCFAPLAPLRGEGPGVRGFSSQKLL